jgi:hypothetical protein
MRVVFAAAFAPAAAISCQLPSTRIQRDQGAKLDANAARGRPTWSVQKVEVAWSAVVMLPFTGTRHGSTTLTIQETP